MPVATISVETTLKALCCGECGMWFAMEERFYRSCRETKGKGFHCPNGHLRQFCETADEELAKAKAQTKRYAKWLADEEARRQAAERSNAALRGVVTRTKKRVGNGVCPCCNRTFQQLARHMEAKHPGYADSETR